MQSQPTGQQLQQLQSALLDAFDYDKLTQLVRYELGRNLEWFTPVQGKRDLTTIVDDLVTYCASKEGGLKRLLKAARENNPNNPKLIALANEWVELDFAPLSLPESHPAFSINTGGGSYTAGDMQVGRDLIGRDNIKHGDTVHGDKVEGDKNVYVDTKSSRWSFGVSLAALTVLIIIVTAIWLTVNRMNDTISQPPPAPLPPTPTSTPLPVIMTGDVNIAIGKPQVVQTGEEVQLAQFQAWSNQELIDRIKEEFKIYSTDDEFEIEVQVLPDSIDSVAEMISYGDEIGVDLLLYGLLDVTQNRVTYAPQFYIHPRFAVGVSELSGNEAFGNPIPVAITATGADTVAWKNDLSQRLADWAAFIVGLGLFDAKAYDKTLTVLEDLDISDGWEDDTGKAVLYLWLGTTHMAKAQYDQARGIWPAGSIDCIASDAQASSNAECGLLSYQKALALEPNYRRAQMGIGNYSLEIEKPLGCLRFDKATKVYEEALHGATQPEEQAAKYLETALVPLKLNYQLGLTHARAVEEACDPIDQHVTMTIEHLQRAVAMYEEHGDKSPPLSSSARDLTARAYYQMGRVYRMQNQPVNALAAFSKTMAVAQPSERLNDPWQSIYWVALNQIGAIHLTQYEKGDDTAFDLARETLSDVTQAFDQKKFGENFDTEPFAASAAWFHLGRLYRAKAERVADEIDRSQLPKAENAYKHSIEVLCPIDQSDPKLINYRNDGLPWISYFELGEVYRLWGKNENALQHYQAVIAAMEARRIGDNDLALAISSRSALGMGKIRFAQGKFDDAVRLLELAINASGDSAEITQETVPLLEKMSAQHDTKQSEPPIVKSVNYCEE